MVEWHVGADQIAREWSWEMLWMYAGAMKRRKRREAAALAEARQKSKMKG